MFCVALLAAWAAGCAAPDRPLSNAIVKAGLATVKTARRWDVAAEPVRIAGPIHFVGTKGLGVFLFVTEDGLILLNTGLPGSGPMIERSIRKAGFAPEHLAHIIVSHGHIDHVGGLAYLKREYPDTKIAAMKEDVPLLQSGGLNDPVFGNALDFKGVEVDRVLGDGDTIALGGLVLTAYHTPGHSRGATTWVTEIEVEGRRCAVAVPDGGGILPLHRLMWNPSYEGIAENYWWTLEFLATLQPDIWLTPHNKSYDLNRKRRRAATEGVRAWIDPAGYRNFIDAQKRKFERRVSRTLDLHEMVARPDCLGR